MVDGRGRIQWSSFSSLNNNGVFKSHTARSHVLRPHSCSLPFSSLLPISSSLLFPSSHLLFLSSLASHGHRLPLQTLETTPPPPSAPEMAWLSYPTRRLLLFLFLLAAVSASDVDLLLSFKSSLPNPDVLHSWNKPSSSSICSSFYGVSCSSSGDVVSVRLDSVILNTDFRHVAAYLLPISSLVSLSLRDSNVTGFFLSSVGGKCAGTLENVDLSGNAVQGSVTALPSFSSACSGLKLLNLSGNVLGFSPRDHNSGAGEKQLLGIDVLDLSFNMIAGRMALGWFFSSAAGVKHLDLSGNRISGSIPAFSDCSRLEYLDVSSNNLSEIGSAGLFSRCERLSFFNVSSNLISGKVPKELFGSCGSLLRLDMSFNNFSGAFPDDFSNCAGLDSVTLSSNNFSGVLPFGILLSLKNLKKLELGYNRFSGVLPKSLTKLSSLEVLDMSSNELSGSIPAGLCLSEAGEELVSLQRLYLQNNLLNGSIPATISDCSMLVSLDLSFNYLTGGIPASIGSLTRLKDLIMWQNNLEGEIPEEIGRLKLLENLILDNNDLNGSIPNGLRNCTNLNWVSLSSNRLTGPIPPWIGEFKNLAILKMGNNSLSGPIPPELGDCKSLIWIDLNSNMLNGSIPHSLAKQSGIVPVGLVKGRRYVYLRNDGSDDCHGSGNLLEFAGIRQEELNRIPSRQSCNFTRVYMGSTEYTFDHNGSIIFIDLSYNQLSGDIPKELGNILFVFIVNLGHNLLSGPIPPELGKLRYLGILDLSHNSLDGPIPTSFSGLAMLAELDLSYNNLSGRIPDVGQLATFPSYRYEHNPGLCGFPLPPCGSNSSAPARHQDSHRNHASLIGSVAMGLLFSLFCIFGLIIVAVESKKRRRKKEKGCHNDGDEEGRDVYFGSRWNSGVGNSSWKLTCTKEVMSINLAAFENPLRKLTFADLLEATNGFHDDSLIGSGGFGDVYKAQLKDGSVVAIKKLIHVSGQGDREFTAEMETIGKIKHRNLVPLLGYCKVGEERLLVYEYMTYGSLEDVLRKRKEAGGVSLNWAKRRKIAVGAARGLAFLHHNCLPHIIHRDMKSSNVLLDDSLEARVSDFGMARLMSAMDTHLSVSTLAGTPGYVPPEYYQSFRCSAKGDVYSYGVVLLELLTGRQPTDSSDFGEDNNLVGWVKQHSRQKITDVFDPELLKEDPGLELELLEHLKIACACLDDRPLRRPTMLNVMAMLKEIQAAGSTVGSTTPAPNPTSMELSLTECKEEKDSDSA